MAVESCVPPGQTVVSNNRRRNVDRGGRGFTQAMDADVHESRTAVATIVVVGKKHRLARLGAPRHIVSVWRHPHERCDSPAEVDSDGAADRVHGDLMWWQRTCGVTQETATTSGMDWVFECKYCCFPFLFFTDFRIIKDLSVFLSFSPFFSANHIHFTIKLFLFCSLNKFSYGFLLCGFLVHWLSTSLSRETFDTSLLLLIGFPLKFGICSGPYHSSAIWILCLYFYYTGNLYCQVKFEHIEWKSIKSSQNVIECAN